MNQNAAMGNVNPKRCEGRSMRFRNLTPKQLTYKCDILCEKRGRINGRLIRNYAIIEDVLILTGNVVAAKEEMPRLNDLFKTLLSAHEEYNALLEDEARVKDDEWFD